MKTAMQLMEELGLHEGGVENWIPGNAWETFADLIRADEREALIRYFDGHWRDEWSEGQIIEALEARGKT